MPLDIVAENGTSIPVLRVIGEIDVTSVETLRQRIREQFERGATSLAFDLTQLSFIDSMGIGALFGAKKRAVEAEGEVFLLEPSGVLQRLLSVLAMEPMFTICSLQEFRERCAARAPKTVRKPA